MSNKPNAVPAVSDAARLAACATIANAQTSGVSSVALAVARAAEVPIELSPAQAALAELHRNGGLEADPIESARRAALRQAVEISRESEEVRVAPPYPAAPRCRHCGR